MHEPIELCVIFFFSTFVYEILSLVQTIKRWQERETLGFKLQRFIVGNYFVKTLLYYNLQIVLYYSYI